MISVERSGVRGFAAYQSTHEEAPAIGVGDAQHFVRAAAPSAVVITYVLSRYALNNRGPHQLLKPLHARLV